MTELCRREDLHKNFHSYWSKDFLEGGKKRLTGDAECEVRCDDVSALPKESAQLKTALRETSLENQPLKKSVLVTGEYAF